MNLYDISKSWEENQEIYRERYKKVHGEYPAEPTEEDKKWADKILKEIEEKMK